MSMGQGTVLILFNRNVPAAQPLAEEMAAWLQQQGQSVAISRNDVDAAEVPGLEQAALIVSLGGDGSLLRAAQMVAPHGAPILGVNLGRVGFLTETEPQTWREVLSQVLAGEHWLEERMMLCVTLNRGAEEVCQAHALNDVVVGRGARAHVVRLQVSVDGGRLATYAADGLIVATATGSTAYALAAGGPILPPQLRNILLVPVAPHLSMDRPVVLSEGVKVGIQVDGDEGAVLTVDGAVRAELETGDEAIVAASPYVTRFARVKETNYFYRTLVARLVPRN